MIKAQSINCSMIISYQYMPSHYSEEKTITTSVSWRLKMSACGWRFVKFSSCRT